LPTIICLLLQAVVSKQRKKKKWNPFRISIKKNLRRYNSRKGYWRRGEDYER
jgi:hypothetical protein